MGLTSEKSKTSAEEARQRLWWKEDAERHNKMGATAKKLGILIAIDDSEEEEDDDEEGMQEAIALLEAAMPFYRARIEELYGRPLSVDEWGEFEEAAKSKFPAMAKNYKKLSGVKGNPYRDEFGRFASGDGSKLGSAVSKKEDFDTERKGAFESTDKDVGSVIGSQRSRQRERIDKSKFRPATEEDRKAYGIPKGYTNPMVIKDPSEGYRVVAIADNPKNKSKPYTQYSEEWNSQRAADKFGRIKVMMNQLPEIDQRIADDIAQGNVNAMALRIIRRTGMRPGGEKQQGVEKVFGATNLELGHVRVADGSTIVHFNFIGKENVRQRHHIDDPELAEYVRKMKRSGKGRDTRLFDTDSKKLNKYVDEVAPGFTTKDFRTNRANERALFLVKKAMKQPETVEELVKYRNEVGNSVAKILGNQPKQALDTYISPAVFYDWIDGLPSEERAKYNDAFKKGTE